MSKRTRGTKQWSKYTENLVYGCPYGCNYEVGGYCYACRFLKRSGLDPKPWTAWRWRNGVEKKGFKKRSGRTMVPSLHDIFPEILEVTTEFLKRLLKPGNEVLITTKPHPYCIRHMADELEEWKDLITWRLTITTPNPSLMAKYEPFAPTLHERMNSLIYLQKRGYETTVSAEPFLSDPVETYKLVEPYITGGMWVGPMSGKVPTEFADLYSRLSLMMFENQLDRLPKTRFKDGWCSVTDRDKDFGDLAYLPRCAIEEKK